MIYFCHTVITLLKNVFGVTSVIIQHVAAAAEAEASEHIRCASAEFTGCQSPLHEANITCFIIISTQSMALDCCIQYTILCLYCTISPAAVQSIDNDISARA